MATPQLQPVHELGIDTPPSRRYKLLHGALLRYGMSLMLLMVFSIFLTFAYRQPAMVLSEIVRNGIVYSLLGVGASIVIATSEIDMSSLGVATLSGIIFALIASHVHNTGALVLTVAAALMGVLIFSVLSGLCVSYCVTSMHAPPLIFTWALGSVYVLLSILLTRFASASVVKSVSSIGLPWQFPSSAWNIGGLAFTLTLFGLVLVIALLSGLSLPNHARAVGGNADSARYAGISRTTVLRGAFVTNAVLSGIAGTIQALQYKGATTKDMELSVNGLVPIAIALIGGTSLSGGYLSLWSVVFAAFFWSATSLLGPILPNYVPFLEPLQAELGHGVFFLVFLLVALLFGRTLSPPASKIYASKESE